MVIKVKELQNKITKNIIISKIKNLEKKTHGWENIKKLIFPPVCGICGKLNENYLCNKCNLALQKEAGVQVDSYITETRFKRKHFDEHIYFFQYQGLIRDQIINYKFNDESYKYKAISNFILKNFILKESKIFQTLNDYDVIVPVPISRKRMKERGYNQSELIAEQIANAMEKRLITKCLYKCKDIIAQSKLNKEEREVNIKDVYAIKNEHELFNKKVLLFDDIYTTGSTVNECSRILGKAGTDKIGVITIAKD